MEKHRDRSRNKESEHRVTVAGKTKTVRLTEGKNKVNDLLAELKNKYKDELKSFHFNSSVSVVLDGKVVKMNDKGEIEGNPLLAESSTLSLMPNIAGGI